MASRKDQWCEGSDILLLIQYENPNGTFKNLTSEYINIIVYVWTKKDYIVKFSKKTMYKTVNNAEVEDKSYYKLVKHGADDTTYELVIPSKETGGGTTGMKPGVMAMQMNFISNSSNANVTDNNFNDVIESNNIGTLIPSIIKIES